MSSLLKIRDIEARQGEKKFGWMKIGERKDSRPAEVPLILINGKSPGPTVYLQAAIDGDELNPIGVVRRVTKNLEPDKVSGKIIAVLFANFFGFHSGQAFNPIDNVSMNRVWPGRETGTSSERIVHQLWNEAIIHANYAIDIHQTGTSPSVGSVYVRVGKEEPNHDVAMEMAKTFGMGYILDEKESKIYASDAQNPKAAETKLAWQATVRGTPTITPELPGTRGWNEDSIKKGVQGVENVLKSLKVIEGEAPKPKKTFVVRHVRTMLTGRGGFVEYKQPIGAIVRKGEDVAEISDPFGETLEVVRAPEDGILWRTAEFPMLSSGEFLASFGTDFNEW